jgi:hypothetical protein
MLFFYPQCLVLSSLIVSSITAENDADRSKRSVEIEIVPLSSAKEYFTDNNPMIDRSNEDEFNKYHMFIETLYAHDKTKDAEQEVSKHSYGTKNNHRKRSADTTQTYQAQSLPQPMPVYYQESQDLFYHRQPKISHENTEQVSAYDSFLKTLYKFDKNKDTNSEVQKRLSKRDTEAVTDLESERKGRELIFRPLFVYKQQELKKRNWQKKRLLTKTNPKPLKSETGYPPKKYYSPYHYAEGVKPLQTKYFYPIEQ